MTPSHISLAFSRQKEMVLDAGGHEKMVVIAAVFLLAPALFEALLPYDIRNAMLVFGCIIAGGLFLGHREFDLCAMGVGLGWLAFAVFALVDRYATGGSLGFSQMALPLAAFAACVSACSTTWLKTALRCVAVMLTIHLVATLSFYALPNLYIGTVKMRFFADSANAIGYQSGLTSHYSDNGFLMVLGLILCASFSLGESRDVRRRWAILAVLFLFGLILTQKRAHLLFGAFSLVCLFAMTNVKGKTLKFLLLAIVAFVAGSAAVSFVPGVAASFERIVGTFDSGDMAETTTGRIFLWNAAIKGWLASPIVGNGWGSFRYVWPGGNASIYAHNEILQLLNDVGVVGLVLFAALALSSFVLAFNNVRYAVQTNAEDSTIRVSAYFSFALQLFLLVYSCTTGGLLQQPLIYISYFFAVAIGLALRYSLRWHDGKRSRVRQW